MIARLPLLLLAMATGRAGAQADSADDGRSDELGVVDGSALDTSDAGTTANGFVGVDADVAVAEDTAGSVGEPMAAEVPSAVESNPSDASESTASLSPISVPISPGVVLSLHCSQEGEADAVPCDATPSENELQLIESAVEEYIRANGNFELAVSFDLENTEVEYDSLELAASLPGRRLETQHVRRRLVEGDTQVLLSGTANFNVPSDLSASDPSIPTERHLSQLLLTILVEQEDWLLEDIRLNGEILGSDHWMAKVAAYDASFEGDSLGTLAGSPADDGVDAVDATSTQDRGAALVAANVGALEDTGTSDGSTNNILLIIGAAGAAASLLLLVGGLCYAKRSYTKREGAKKKSSSGDANVQFEPGKNNPRSPNGSSRKSSLFKKKSSRDSNLAQQAETSDAPPATPFVNQDTNKIDDDDDEEDEDFLLARAALDHSANKKGGDEGSVADNTFGEDMSYAFTVDGESLAPIGGADNDTTSNTVSDDVMVAAGGMASFANDKGVFRWNEDGTKMIYTPKIEKSGSDEQNGFVFDEGRKKWVVKEQIVGERGVSFANTIKKAGGSAGPPSLLRARSGDSAGTGMTGLTDFSYGEVALDLNRRTQSGGTERSFNTSESLGVGAMTPTPSSPTTPTTPSTPQDEGVEVPLVGEPQPGPIQPSGSFGSEFAPNTNMSRFMSHDDDDGTAFSGFTDFTGNTSKLVPRPVTPERVSSQNSDAETFATFGTFATGDPGRIVPKKAASKPNRMQIAEDLPFDEGIPFDERTRSGAASSKRGKGGLVLPNILDDYMDGNESGSDGSVETASSEQVLEDLNKLSKFMVERKRSSKGQSSTSSSRRRRKGSGSGASGGMGRLGNSRSLRYSDRGI